MSEENENKKNTGNLKGLFGDADTHKEYPYKNPQGVYKDQDCRSWAPRANRGKGKDKRKKVTVSTRRTRAGDDSHPALASYDRSKSKVHVCARWQNLLERIMSQINTGSVLYSTFLIPESKLSYAERIDDKIIRKYNCNLSRDQRSNERKKGMAVFQYFRYETFGIILCVPGVMRVEDCEPLKNCIENPIIIKVGTIELEFRTKKVKNERQYVTNPKKLRNTFTVSMTEGCMASFRNQLNELAKQRKINEMIEAFNRLNGIPAYGGMIACKSRLAKHIDYLSKLHQFQYDKRKIRLNTRRKVYGNNPGNNAGDSAQKN